MTQSLIATACQWNFGSVADWAMVILTGTSLFFLFRYVQDTSKIRQLSQDQLNEFKTSSANQSAENHFFNLLDGYNSLIGNLHKKIPHNGLSFEAKDCLREIASLIRGTIPAARQANETVNQFQSRIAAIFDPHYQSHADILGHYFRYQYNVLRYIEDAHIDETVKSRYVNIFKAHISDFEFELIFLNALTTRGQNYKTLIERTGLLQNWFRDGDPSVTYKNIRQEGIFQDTAF